MLTAETSKQGTRTTTVFRVLPTKKICIGRQKHPPPRGYTAADDEGTLGDQGIKPTCLDTHTYIYAPPVQPIVFEEKRCFYGCCGSATATATAPFSSSATVSSQPLKVPIFQVENSALHASLAATACRFEASSASRSRRSSPVADCIQVLPCMFHIFFRSKNN